MSFYSKQKHFCRTCGGELFTNLAGAGSMEYCSMDCKDEFEWRRTLSLLGKEYYIKEI